MLKCVYYKDFYTYSSNITGIIYWKLEKNKHFLSWDSGTFSLIFFKFLYSTVLMKYAKMTFKWEIS